MKEVFVAKHCPFAFSQAPEFRECMGEACVNFEWRHFEKETKTIGSCKFFDRCPHGVADVCLGTEPALESPAAGHMVRCRRIREVATETG